jgi:hypothetical protein
MAATWMTSLRGLGVSRKGLHEDRAEVAYRETAEYVDRLMVGFEGPVQPEGVSDAQLSVIVARIFMEQVRSREAMAGLAAVLFMRLARAQEGDRGGVR